MPRICILYICILLRSFEMPKYIVHVFMLFLFCFCTDMAGEEDEQQRLIREVRMRKGKEASTVSARREGGSKPVCPKDSEA